MVNRTYIQQGGGTTVRATAQGAQSIEVEVSASPSYGQGYGGGYGRVYDPMQFAQRTFFTWACIGLAVTAAGVATGHHLVCLFAIPAVFICLRASYDVFRWRNGGVWGLSAFGIWLLSPSDWWPVKAGDDGQEPSPPMPRNVNNRAPMAYYARRGADKVRNVWFRVQQIPRRAYCAAFGTVQPAPVGTLRLSFEPPVRHSYRLRPGRKG
jgi:hypothetical protein